MLLDSSASDDASAGSKNSQISTTIPASVARNPVPVRNRFLESSLRPIKIWSAGRQLVHDIAESRAVLQSCGISPNSLCRSQHQSPDLDAEEVYVRAVSGLRRHFSKYWPCPCLNGQRSGPGCGCWALWRGWNKIGSCVACQSVPTTKPLRSSICMRRQDLQLDLGAHGHFA